MLALVADDDAAIRRLIARICARSGLEVAACASGSELVGTARRLRPGLIVSDFHMPGEPDGLQACSLIRRELPKTAFILMTGDTLQASAIRGAGFNLVLLKPFTIGQAALLIADIA